MNRCQGGSRMTHYVVVGSTNGIDSVFLLASFTIINMIG